MFDDSYGTLNISITRIVALEKGFTDMENYVTFLYLGDKPVIEGSQARLEYYPVKPGQVITNNNVASLISSGAFKEEYSFCIVKTISPSVPTNRSP